MYRLVVKFRFKIDLGNQIMAELETDIVTQIQEKLDRLSVSLFSTIGALQRDAQPSSVRGEPVLASSSKVALSSSEGVCLSSTTPQIQRTSSKVHAWQPLTAQPSDKWFILALNNVKKRESADECGEDCFGKEGMR